MNEQHKAEPAVNGEIENDVEISIAGGTIPARLEETVRAARKYAEAPGSPKNRDSDVEDLATYCHVPRRAWRRELAAGRGRESPRPCT